MKIAKELFRKITIIFILIAIFMSRFSILGGELISYAIDTGRVNNNNIEISAYFVDENDQKEIEKESKIDESLKLKIEVTVKNEKGFGGYLDGNIELSNANFKFKDNNNTGFRVNAGETQVIEKEIEYQYKESIDNNYLNKQSQVLLKGKYVNSKKTYDIEGSANVLVKWISSDEIKTEIKTEVLTYEEKLLQLLIESNLKNNSYPIQNTNIEIKLPEEIEEDNIENIKIHKRTTDGTNGNKEFDESNYEINDNKVIINIDNLENPMWKKDTSDILILTLELKEDKKLENAKITGNSKVTLYDEKILTGNIETTITENKNGKITSEIEEKEKEIYKGKIYTGEERTYKSTTKINVDYIKDIDKIEVYEKKPVYIANEEKNANISYVKTEISKKEFEEIFGNDGYILIEDQDGNTIANINKDIEQDENGIITINYSDEITNIKIITSKPEKIGIINIDNTKKIVEDKLGREDKKAIKTIKEETVVNDNISNSEIKLKETKTEATIDIDHTSFRNSEINEDVKIELSFLTNGEDKDLYKNPTFEIIFPIQFQKIDAKYRMLYGNGLKIKNATILEREGKKIFRFELEGNQEKYLTETVEDTKIIIYTNITVNEKAENVEESILLKYNNEKAIELVNNGEKQLKVNIIADKKEKEEKDNSIEENKNIDNKDIKIETTFKAEVGENTLENNAEVKAGEVIRYKMTVKNAGNKDIKGLKITGLVPEGTTHVEPNEKTVTYGFVGGKYEVEYKSDGGQYFVDDFDYYNKTENKTITKKIDLNQNQTITIEYEVKVNYNIEKNKIITNTMTTQYNNEDISKKSISNKLINSEIEITTLPVLRENLTKKLESGYAYEYNVRVKNLSNITKKNIYVNLITNELLKIISIGQKNENDEYIESYDTKSIKILEIKPGQTAKLIIQARVEEPKPSNGIATISANIKQDGTLYRSNKIYENVESTKLNISLTSSNRKEYINPGEEITYYINVKNDGEVEADSLWVSDYISEYLNIENVKIDSVELKKEQYDIYENDGYKVMNFGKPLKPGKSLNIEINTKLPETFKASKEIEVKNYAKAMQTGLEKNTNTIIYRVKANSISGESGSNYYGGEEYPEDLPYAGNRHSISGLAWYDENRNGKRDINEEKVSGVEVLIVDIATNKFAKDSNGDVIKDITGDSGEYTLKDIEQGNYIIIFKYNTDIYTTTTYVSDNAQNDTNSDAISRELTIDGVTSTVGTTDIISLYGDINNIDIGLAQSGIFSLEVDKTISKITLKNKEGTKTYNYDDKNLAKVEISAKNLRGTTVLVEYKIRVKNTGTIGGYAKTIVDYCPKNLKFNEGLNQGWYVQGNYLYNQSLGEETIEPGESKEIPIVLSMVMTETNTGLVNNIAAVEEAYDINGIASTEKSESSTHENTEDKITKGSADIIIGVRTGAVTSYVITILTTIILLGLIAYFLIKKIVLKR